MPETTPDPVPSAEAVEAFLTAPKVDDAGLSGRWGHQHTAPIPEGLAGLGARGQGPVAPGPTLAELKDEVRRLTGWINDCARAARLPADMEFADVAAGIQAELVRVQHLADSRISEMRRRDEAIGRAEKEWKAERERANEAIAQLHDARRELAALRAILPTPGKR